MVEDVASRKASNGSGPSARAIAAGGSGGFSLIDMAILLTVASLLLVSLLSKTTVDREESNLRITRERLTHAQAALDYFIKMNGYVPCPALRGQTLASANFLIGDCVSSANATEVSSGGFTVRIGVLPSRMLGIADAEAVDGWGNLFTYAMILQLRSTGGYAGFSNPTATNGVIDVRLGVPVADTPLVDRPNDTTVYVVVSHGKDGRGAWRPNGTQAGSCPTAAPAPADAENCDNDAVFRDYWVDDAVAPTDPDWFHDLLRYRRRAEL